MLIFPKHSRAGWIAAILAAWMMSSPQSVLAQRGNRGGGGGRPPGAQSGSRAPGPSGGARAPSMSRPTLGNTRPQGSSGVRPPSNIGNRPSLGGGQPRPSGGPSRPGGPSFGGGSQGNRGPGSHTPPVRPSVITPGNQTRPGRDITVQRPVNNNRPSGAGGQSGNRPGSVIDIGNRPSLGGVARPAPSQPGRPNRPDTNRPDTGRPGGNRPDVGQRPGDARPPANRPDSGNRPGDGGRPGGNRPDIGQRPDNARPPANRPGSGNRPGDGDRPGPNRPDFGQRPGDGRPSANRPDFGNRPGDGRPGSNRPGDRPGTNRPGFGNRPGNGRPPERPIIGNRPGHRPGDWDHRPGNRPGDRPGNRPPNWNRPDRPSWNPGGWGWNGGDRYAHYHHHHHYVNPHYNWYRGSWAGYGRNSWYRPYFWGTVTGFGLGTIVSGWGYGYGAYYNPYYVGLTPVYASTYNYAQPVVVYNYTTPQEPSVVYLDSTQPPPEDDPGIRAFDDGLARFKAGDYQNALRQFDEALKAQPNDPVIHEVRALTLFALGEYQPAAAALNALLSSTPGMNWTTLSSLYGNVNDYTTQLRALEAYCRQHPNNAAAYFVLAYHYMVIGSTPEAIGALKVVLQNEPKDVVARQLLDTLEPPKANDSASAEPTPPATDPLPTPPPLEVPSEEDTDLVGTWKAEANGTVITLTVTPESDFVWKAKQPNQPEVTVSGQLTTDEDSIILSSKDQGTMEGGVTSLGPNAWRFRLMGAPADDPGLKFERVSP